MFGLSTSKQFNLSDHKLALLEAFQTIEILELKKNLIELDCVELSANGNKLVVDMVLPTFALRSEKEVATRVKELAIANVPAGVDVELNVYADVMPVTTQSLLKEGVMDVRNIILVASGKGGVGKSTVASNLAAGLAKLGCKVGLLDADVYGPSVPTMFGVPQNTEVGGVNIEGEKEPYMMPIVRHGVKLMSIGFLVDTSSAMIWRGPMIASASMQMFHQVLWGDLDYLVVDLPPGTGDIQLTISQRVMVAGAVVVSTPQDVALADVIRAKSMFDKVNIPVLGIVENMSYFICDSCDKRHEILTHGGAKAAAEKLEVPFLGEIPIELGVCKAGDAGTPEVLAHNAQPSSQAFMDLAHNVATTLAVIANEQSAHTAPTVSVSQGLSLAKKKTGLPIIT